MALAGNWLGRGIKGMGRDTAVLAGIEAELLDSRGRLAAIDRVMGVIEFALDGTILTANDNFLRWMGYALPEVQGHHHRMFLDPAEAASLAYQEFWASLNRGEFQAREFRRIGTGGREVWIQASYNPILDAQGRPQKVIKFATDITASKQRHADVESQIRAVNRSMAVIEFDLDGMILSANPNFLAATGYTLADVVGQHHRMFVSPAYAASAAYKEFWAQLRQGAVQGDAYRRLAKGGRTIWLQATYNPILGADGKPVKVVKYAVDITATKDLEEQVAATATSLGESAAELIVMSDQMASAAGETAEKAGSVSAASVQVAASVDTVAAAADEMTASIREIAHSAAQAARVASRAVEVAGTTDRSVAKLGASSAEIGQVLKVITSIAEQTNLLALNATIEAARAGAAGRGFAVVANEVKDLAKETARATDDIGRRIEAIQADTRTAVLAIREITEVITRISELQTSIAGAVEEQTATTNEIGRNVGQAASGVSDIARTVEAVAHLAQRTSASMGRAHEAAARLNAMANDLTTLTRR